MFSRILSFFTFVLLFYCSTLGIHPQPINFPMFIAQVTGSVVATQKTPSMTGHKLLLVEPFRVDPETRTKLISTGRTFVTVDSLGAGVGEFVLICQGSSARLTAETKNLPVDCVVIGIVDSAHVGANCVYSKD
jgi:microcompartment protein CcmK/EutM